MNLPRSSVPDEPDFAVEHSHLTFEDEPDDLPHSRHADESVPKGPANEGNPDNSKPL